MRILRSPSLCKRIRDLAVFVSKNNSTEASANRWRVVASICVERFPITCPELDDMQRRYKDLVSAVELENSLLSEHEVRLIEDQKRLEQRKMNPSDDTEERVLTAQDFEDFSAQEFEAFKKRYMQPGESVTDAKSLKRCLSRKLVLTVRNPLKKRWLFPEAYLNDDIDQFLLPYGFAPIGFHRFKYPKPIVKENNAVGEKIFFYKCQIKQKNFDNCIKETETDYKWLTHDELVQFVPPSYYSSVRKFLIE